MVAKKRHLPAPWPEQSLFDGILSKAAGLFIFIDTLARDIDRRKDPTDYLKGIFQDSASHGLTSLYGLYSSILNARIVYGHDEFRRVIGVLLATALHRPLCEETIGKLARVEDSGLVVTWVDELSSMLDRDEGANGAIRVRHLSIVDFFVSDGCPADYRVNLVEANAQLGIACFETMLSQLRFNICKLTDSRIANADVKDLSLRIKDNISEVLQYSCIYWSDHLCTAPGDCDRRVLKDFFEGIYPLFWIEVLSVMGMVRVGIHSLRRLLSGVKVSTIQVRYWLGPQMDMNLCRMLVLALLRKFETFIIS
jgi:hypothetical protein